MTRSEIKTFLTDFSKSLSMMVDRDAKDEAVVEAINALCDALTYRVEREFADHCSQFDPREVLSRLDEEVRRRRQSGPLASPPGTPR